MQSKLFKFFHFAFRHFGHQFFDTDGGKVADFNLRQDFRFHIKLYVFAVVKRGDADVRTQSQLQLIPADDFVGRLANRFVQRLAHNRRAIFLFQHFFRRFARTETRQLDVFGDFVQFLFHFCFKILVFDNHLIFFLQAFCFLFCNLHFLLLSKC